MNAAGMAGNSVRHHARHSSGSDQSTGSRVPAPSRLFGFEGDIGGEGLFSERGVGETSFWGEGEEGGGFCADVSVDMSADIPPDTAPPAARFSLLRSRSRRRRSSSLSVDIPPDISADIPPDKIASTTRPTSSAGVPHSINSAMILPADIRANSFFGTKRGLLQLRKSSPIQGRQFRRMTRVGYSGRPVLAHLPAQSFRHRCRRPSISSVAQPHAFRRQSRFETSAFSRRQPAVSRLRPVHRTR